MFQDLPDRIEDISLAIQELNVECLLPAGAVIVDGKVVVVDDDIQPHTFWRKRRDAPPMFW